MRPRAYISHQIPGRVRIIVPEGKRNPVLLGKLRDLVRSVPGVESVDCNPLTGSMLIHYTPRPQEDLPAFLSPNGGPTTPFSLDPPTPVRTPKKVRRRAPGRREHSEGARAVMGIFGELDDAIRAATGNVLDLKVLIPLLAGALGIILLPRTKSTPLWLTLMIFAFSSFLMLHEPGTPEAEMAELAAEMV